MSNTKLFSSVVLTLRFPLMILVLLIHSLPTDSNGIGGDTFLYIGTLVKELFTRVAVPAFFVFSGYYALKGHNLEQWGTYKAELKKKVRTLILPLSPLERVLSPSPCRENSIVLGLWGYA